MSLVKLNTEKELVVSLDDISQFSGVKYESIQRIVRDNADSLNKMGEHIPTVSKRGTSDFKSDLFLNEPQTTLLMMFMKNTPKVKEFKIKLTMEFFKMRELLKNGTIPQEVLDTFLPDGAEYLAGNKQGNVKSQPVRGYFRADSKSEIGKLLSDRHKLFKRANGLLQEEVNLALAEVESEIHYLQRQGKE